MNDLAELSAQESRQQYAKRQEKKFSRLAEFSLDSEKQKKYIQKRNEWKSIANVGDFDIMKIETEKRKFAMINNIETRNNTKGKPSAISRFDVEVNHRQKRLLDELKEYDSQVIVRKNKVSMFDLSALTAQTGVEYAMFTRGGERLIIRGNETSVNVTEKIARELHKSGYKWSGHTHPGNDVFALFPSEGDKQILEIFNQEYSVIYNSIGRFYVFERE